MSNLFSRVTEKTVFFEIFVEEDYDDEDYDDYYYDEDYDDFPVKKEDGSPIAEKQKAGKWMEDLEKDEATEGMLKEKVDEMVKKMSKMKVFSSYLIYFLLIFLFRLTWSERLNFKPFWEHLSQKIEICLRLIWSVSTTGRQFSW